MTDPNGTPSAVVRGPITPDQAQDLRAAPVYKFDKLNPGQNEARAKADAILTGIGSTALTAGWNETAPGREAFALVATRDEEGNEVPSHYVALDSADLGTRVEGPTADALGLPLPKTALEMLEAEKAMRETAVVEPAQPGEFDHLLDRGPEQNPTPEESAIRPVDEGATSTARAGAEQGAKLGELNAMYGALERQRPPQPGL